MASGYLLNMEDVLNSLDKPPIFANDFSVGTEEEKTRFDNMLLTVYEQDTLNPTPQCSCGNVKGRFRLGERCNDCGDIVTEIFASTIESNIWLIPLPGTDAFITPVMWQMLRDRMRLVGGFDTLKWLTDSYYRFPKGLPDRIQFLLDKGHERGLNYFHKNFDKVMHDLIHYNGKNKIPAKLESLIELIKYNRDKIFTGFLPVPNRVMFPIEKSGKASYGDKSMVHIVNAVRVIQEGESRRDTLSPKQMEHRMVKCIELFAKFHFEYVKKVLGTKNGALRQHLLGGRWHFTSRAVIGSIYEPHDFREVHFPWVVAVEQFKMLLTNKLIRRNHSLDEISDLLRKHAVTYSPYLAEIFDELIKESPYIGLPIIFQRNPTIKRPSAILVYVSKIKSNSNDHTIAASVGNLTGMNADFDGDALNTVHIQDQETHDRFAVLAPEHNVMDLSTPWGISSNLKLQPPVVSTTANWILQGRKKAYADIKGGD